MNMPTRVHTHARPAQDHSAQDWPAQPRTAPASLANEAEPLHRHPSGRAVERPDGCGETPVPVTRSAYWPELGEEPPARLFHSEYNFAGTYSVCWKIEDDQAARVRLRELRIFPRRIEHHTPAEWLQAQRLGADVFSCLITSKAHCKLQDADLVAIRILLD
jgi:hypothetical protein